jgi:ribosomal protein L30E
MWNILKSVGSTVGNVALNTLKTTGNVALSTAQTAGNVALGAGKLAVSAVQPTGNIVWETGKFTLSALQTLDKQAKVLFVSNIPSEIKEAIKQGKMVISRTIIKNLLRDYFLTQNITLVDLSLKPNRCAIIATTKKGVFSIKIKLALDFEKIEIKQLSSQETGDKYSEIYLNFVVVEPLNIAGYKFIDSIIVWIVEKVGFGIFGFDFMPENFRNFRVAGNIISIPVKDFNFNQELKNYFNYVEFVKEVNFVDNAVEALLNIPDWILEILKEDQQQSPQQ